MIFHQPMYFQQFSLSNLSVTLYFRFFAVHRIEFNFFQSEISYQYNFATFEPPTAINLILLQARNR